jgi:hypothetical protein
MIWQFVTCFCETWAPIFSTKPTFRSREQIRCDLKRQWCSIVLKRPYWFEMSLLTWNVNDVLSFWKVVTDLKFPYWFEMSLLTWNVNDVLPFWKNVGIELKSRYWYFFEDLTLWIIPTKFLSLNLIKLICWEYFLSPWLVDFCYCMLKLPLCN